MVDVLSGFLLIASVIVIGFFGQILFKKTKISDTVLLMLVGLAIGPLFNFIDVPTIGFFRAVVPFFAALTLIMLLFDGGLKLNFYKVIREVSPAFGFAILCFALTVLFTAGMMFLLGWSLLVSLMLGVIISGTSSAIIIPLVNSLQVREETRIVLALESALTDALCIIATIALIEILLMQTLELRQVVESLLGAFSIAAVLGFIFAAYWLVLLRDVKGVKEHQYILTIAVLFFLYFLTEYASANGAIAALVFGLVLGNAKEITSFLKMRQCQLDTDITLFQKEISFFIRTFFFIYIGIIFELSSVTIELVAIAIALMFLIIAARAAATRLFVKIKKELREDKAILQNLMARGLAAAILASYPAIMGAAIAEQTALVQIVFLIILFSNIGTTVGVFASKKPAAEKSDEMFEKIDLKELEEKQKIAATKLLMAQTKEEAEKAKKELEQSKQKWLEGITSQVTKAKERLGEEKQKEKQA